MFFMLILIFFHAHLLASEEAVEREEKLFNSFGVGFGGAYAFPFESQNEGGKIWVSSVDLVLNEAIGESAYYQTIKHFHAEAFTQLHSDLKESKFLVYWLVKGWEESWFNVDEMQKALDEGYILVFNYWYFGDCLNGIPTDTEQADYADDTVRVASFLGKLKGTKLLIMEPEFNKESIVSDDETQHRFAEIIAHAIDTIKTDTQEVLFSLAMMDTGSRGEYETYAKCGYDNCALGDKYEWGRAEIVYNDLASRLDFISFQEMVGQFSRDPLNPGTWDEPNPIAYSESSIGINLLARRIANFSHYLQEKYHKPLFLPYIAIATATWSDENNNDTIEEGEIDKHGWDNQADLFYKNLLSIKQELQQNGVFGFAPMALFDDPRHDVGGYQFFMQNEYHLGIVQTGATDELSLAGDGNISTKGEIVSTLFHTSNAWIPSVLLLSM